MSSLRARLILGSALVAVLPLAVALYLLSQRVETMVREQAADRLDRALGGLQAELRVGNDQIGERLRILARSAALKRLYLVRPADAGDLEEFLSEQKFLLGLDFLRVTDRGGTTIAGSGPVESVSPESLAMMPAPALAMTASAPIHYQSSTVGFLAGGLALDGVFLERLKRARGVDLVLRNAAGYKVASTLVVPEGLVAVRADSAPQRVWIGGRPYSSQSFSLDLGAGSRAVLTGLVSSEPADRAIMGFQKTSAALGLVGIGLAVALGVLWSSQVSGPVERLAAFSQRLSQGDWEEPLTLQSVRELQTLVAALERMRGDLRRYRDQLVIGERHAAWSQMARKVAHEVKNPLTPIAVSVADLKRSFDQKRPDFPQILDQAVRTVGEEVETLKRLLNEFSEFGRFPAPRFARCELPTVLADLEALYRGDVASGRLVLSPAPAVAITADAAQLRQALVNLIKNGLEAIREGGRVSVAAALADEELQITVSDDGAGLSADQRANLFVPGFTTKATGSGLGLTIVERVVNDHHGSIAVEPAPNGGTTFRISLPLREWPAAPTDSEARS